MNDGDLSESNETFMVTINSSADVPCYDHCQTTVTVMDNDGNYCSCVWYSSVTRCELSMKG